MKVAAIAALALAGAAAAQDSMSLCDKYSNALFKSTNGTVQQQLLAAVVNTALIGNFSALSAKGPGATGILTKNGTFNGNSVNLLKYFDGSLLSTNRNGKASSVNFLDGGGADPLKELKAANDMNSNQYKLVSHLYSYFGVLLNCTSVGKEGFPAYAGSTNQYQVHQFMNLDANEMGYFISQVGASAASFGVEDADVQMVATALNSVFNVKCGPSISIPPSAPAAPQSICNGEGCQQAPSSTCTNDNQANGMDPATATGSSSMSGGSPSGSAGGSSPSSTRSPGMGGGASKVVSGIAGGAFAAAAVFAATLL